MTFRTRLLLAFVVTVVAAVVLVGAIVSAATERAFARMDEARVSALVAQFRQEFARRQREIAQRVQEIAEDDNTLSMIIGLHRPDANPPDYYLAASPLASAHHLAFLELIDKASKGHCLWRKAAAGN